MDILNSVISRQRNVSLSNIFDFTPLTVPQKNHLKKVYASLAIAVCIAGCGVYTQNNILPIPVFLSFVLKLVSIFLLFNQTNETIYYGKYLSPKRALYFGSFAFFCGASLGNFIYILQSLHPSVLPTAFFGSVAIFSCFSFTAIFAKERSYLYLGSILSSCLMYLSLVSLFNIFFRSNIAFNFVLYASLLVYMGFVIYDTQVTIEEFKRGNRDYLVHALQLYIDLVAIFIRLCLILMDREEKKKQKKKN